jgi:uncharacterized membrane protein YagU involved in acid resistance
MKILHYIVNFIFGFAFLVMLWALALLKLDNSGIFGIIYLAFICLFALYLNNYNDKNI